MTTNMHTDIDTSTRTLHNTYKQNGWHLPFKPTNLISAFLMKILFNAFAHLTMDGVFARIFCTSGLLIYAFKKFAVPSAYAINVGSTDAKYWRLLGHYYFIFLGGRSSSNLFLSAGAGHWKKRKRKKKCDFPKLNLIVRLWNANSYLYIWVNGDPLHTLG